MSHKSWVVFCVWHAWCVRNRIICCLPISSIFLMNCCNKFIYSNTSAWITWTTYIYRDCCIYDKLILQKDWNVQTVTQMMERRTQQAPSEVFPWQIMEMLVETIAQMGILVLSQYLYMGVAIVKLFSFWMTVCFAFSLLELYCIFNHLPLLCTLILICTKTTP